MIARETVMQEQEIDVKRAVQLAKDFAKSLYATEKISHLGLEAVERTQDGRHWLITLGFSRPWTTPRLRKRTFFEEMTRPSEEPQPIREYKVFRVDAQSGEVIGMKMFEE